jgi:hypothetical protein
MNGIEDDVQAAVSSLEGTAAAPAPASAPAAAPVASDFAPVVADKTPTRGEDGRFQPIAPVPVEDRTAKPAEPAKEPVKEPAAAAPAPAPAPVEAAAGAVKLDPSKPPSSWTPQMRDKWSTIPEDIRNEVIRREEAMAQGVQKLQAQYEPASKMFQQVSQYNEYFKHINREAPEYLDDMIRTEQMLTLGNPAQKVELLLNLADSYGVPIRSALDSALNGGLKDMIKQSHEQFQTPPPLPPAIIKELNELRTDRQQMLDSAADAELAQFNSVDRPFFNQVRDNMIRLIETGAAKGYEDAYDMSCWANADIRAKMVAQQNGQAQANGVQTRQAAAAQVSTPAAAAVQGVTVVDPNEDIYATVTRAWNAAESGGRV